MRLFRNVLLVAAALGCQPAHAASVQELKVQDLAAFLAANDTVVVQFTSPDRKCRYCIGADKLFDRAAAPSRDPGIKFARVQWPIWHQFPDFGKIHKPLGLPEQLVFRRGQAIGTVSGKPESAPVLLAQIRQIRANPKDPKDFYRQEQPEAGPAAAPMSAEEEKLTRLLARKDLIGGIVSYCARSFPATGNKMQGAYAAWQQSRKSDLDRAMIVMMTRTSREDARATGALVGEEQKKLQAWTAGSLGIAQDRKPTAEDCEKIARGLASLPEAADQAGAL